MNILGILSILLAQGLFSLTPVILKTNNSPFIYKILFSTITLVIPSLLYFLINDVDYKQDLKTLLLNKNTLISSISYFLYTSLFFYCQQVLPISISLPVFMLYPFILLLLNRFINKESINIGEILGGIITFIGILILSSSPLNKKPTNYYFKIILCLLSGFFCATAYVHLKTNEDRIIVKEDSLKIKKLEEKKGILFNIHANMLLINTIPAILFILILLIKKFRFTNKYNNTLLFKGDTQFKTISQLLIISFIIQYICNLLLQYGLINLNPIIYSSLINCSVIFGFIYGKVFFNESINLQKVIGCIIILLGIGFNIFSSTKINHSKDYLFIKR